MDLNMPVAEIMTKQVISLDKSKSVFDAAKILASKKIGSIIITSDKNPVGILTERDVVSKVVAKGKDPKKIKLEEVMSKPLLFVYSNQSIQDAAISMRQHNIKRLVVFDKKNNKLVGIITQGDLIAVYPAIIDILLADRSD
jgi:CBS domain-containing protein